ncbi:phosphatidic acid phosphatase type 2/haloperoxidase [Flammula alnicola]|nr:phosphatidic acid phosphatase type 2/haloperoxidase [Flammula alnicola]
MTFPIFNDPSPRSPPMTAIRRRKLILSYAPDCAAFFSLDKVTGYRRVFSLEDTSYAVHERIPNLALYMICFVAPLLIMPVINFFTIRSWWDLHNMILALSLTGAMTQIVKITVGRPRPDLIDRCQPPAGLTDPTFGLTSWTVCTQTDFAIMNDGFRSFFSGHSSLSFAGLGFLSYYLAGKLHLFDSRGHTAKAWLALSPFMAASLVAISRTMDYRHHWHDVLVGTAVGILFSFFAYRQYYPALSAPLSHRPYSPRIKGEGHEILPTHKPANSQNYPFVGPNDNHHGFDENHDYELAGTVPRPAPEPLEEMWREGAGNETVNRETVPDEPAQYAPLQIPPFDNGLAPVRR